MSSRHISLSKKSSKVTFPYNGLIENVLMDFLNGYALSFTTKHSYKLTVFKIQQYLSLRKTFCLLLRQTVSCPCQSSQMVTCRIA